MREALEQLKKQCEECTACELYKNRTKTVFGSGDAGAKIMLVGEAPGEKEDLTGEPFVGRAGKLLDELLAAAGLDRAGVYIANILKCRPPDNRDPKTAEQERCIGFLYSQIREIRPEIIVCLGRVASQKLISPDFSVTKQHGEFIKKENMLIMGTFHPAAILRDPRRKPDAAGDFIKAAGVIMQSKQSNGRH